MHAEESSKPRKRKFIEIEGDTLAQWMETTSSKKHLEHSHDGFSDLFEHFLAQQNEMSRMLQQLNGKKHPTQLYGGFLTRLPFFF